MAEGQPLDELRLALMQDVLPMGLAFVDRVRSEGPVRVVESLSQGGDPLADLRKEGEPAARVLRVQWCWCWLWVNSPPRN